MTPQPLAAHNRRVALITGITGPEKQSEMISRERKQTTNFPTMLSAAMRQDHWRWQKNNPKGFSHA